MVCPFYNRKTEGGWGGRERAFQVRGAKLWNGIPFDMRKKKKNNGEIDRMTEKCIGQSKL